MFNQEEKESPPNLKLGVNLIRQDQKFFRLPLQDEGPKIWLEDGATIELVILCQGNVSIECFDFPIRFGNYFCNRLFFNTYMDKFNVNPKFIFDKQKEQWVLINAGYICIAEMELEHKSNHKIYGGENA